MPAISKLCILCLPVAIALGLAGAAPADAKLIQVPSQADLQSLTPDGAAGSVSTTRQLCRSQRTVRLYKEASWGTFNTADVWATARTGTDGAWHVSGPLPQGLYYAVVEAQTVKKRHNRLLCGDSTTGEKYI
jgi:hypothetical protein